MEISYKLEKQDLINARWYFGIVKPPKSHRNFTWFLRGVLLAMAFHSIFSIWQKASWDRRISTIMTWSVLYFMWEMIRRLVALYSTRQDISKSGLISQYTMTLTETELIVQIAVAESRCNWEFIDRIEENDDYLFIVLASQQFYTIPKRAFSDRSQYQDFYDFVKNKISQTNS